MRRSVIGVLALAAVLGYGAYQKQAKAPNTNASQPRSGYVKHVKRHFNKSKFNINYGDKVKKAKFVAGKETAKQKQFAKPLKFDKKAKKSQFQMLPLDQYQRAQGSHIQLDKRQLPKASVRLI